MKSVLKYDVHYSTEEVTFLDCKVKISNEGTETELFTKVTNAHLYLLASSCHPKHTINGIPKGQFVGIRRICSTLDLYWKHTNRYIQFFVERDYNLHKLQNIAKEVSRYNRDDLLAYKIKMKDSVSKIPKDLFVQWHPQISIIKRIEVRTRLAVFTNRQCDRDNGRLCVNSLAVIQIIRQAGVLLSKQ